MNVGIQRSGYPDGTGRYNMTDSSRVRLGMSRLEQFLSDMSTPAKW